MTALDRWDEWEAGLDPRSASGTHPNPADPDSADSLSDPAAQPDRTALSDVSGPAELPIPAEASDVSGPAELSDLYDPATLRAIDARGGEPRRSASVTGWRGGATAGAMVVGMVQGVHHALDDDEAEPVVEIDRERGDAGAQAVTVHLAWGNPAAGVAVVRRWLL